MTKKIIFIVLIIAGAIVLYFLETKWQVVTMLLAAVSGPLKMVWGFISGGNEAEIREKHAKQREQEKQYQENLEAGILEREKRIASLQNELATANNKLSSLEAKRAMVDEEVEQMSLEELQQAGQHYFGS